MPSLDFDKEKSNFREWYDQKHTTLTRAANQLENLVASLTSNMSNLEEPTVLHRLKDREECIRKFALKYQTNLESTSTPYEIKDHLTDLIGLRIICYYETDISRVVNILRENFQVVEETNKSAELEAQDNVFGYKGHHLDLRINGERAKLPEYKEYQGLRFEIQVRSTIQDAWSVLDHKIKYKRSIPHELKRQINALAALFEIADREFTEIHELTEKFKNSVDVAMPTQELSDTKSLDVFEFLAITQSHFPNYQFQDFKADGFVQEINSRDPQMNSHTYKSMLDNNLDEVGIYASYQRDENGNDLNPYTQLRHAFFLFDKTKFKLALYDNQRSTFEKWLNDRQAQK